MAFLRYLDETGQMVSKSLDSRQFIIGRAETCQLSIDSEMVSREHVSIDMEGNGSYRARDMGSRNKTFINGELIRETILAPGSVIRVGEQVIEFVSDEISRDKLDLSFLTPDRTEPPDCEWFKTKSLISLSAIQLEQLSQVIRDQPLTARAEDISEIALGRLLLDLQAERGLIAMRGERKTDLLPLVAC